MSTDNTTADAIEILKRDHHGVKELFKEFARIEGSGATTGLIPVVHEICSQLIIHSMIEEEIFYPAAQHVIKDDDVIREAEIEHATARYLIKKMLPLREQDPYLKAKVRVLREYTQHHINEEENEMFPKLKASQLDLSALGQRLMDRKAALQNELPGADQLIAFVAVGP